MLGWNQTHRRGPSQDMLATPREPPVSEMLDPAHIKHEDARVVGRSREELARTEVDDLVDQLAAGEPLAQALRESELEELVRDDEAEPSVRSEQAEAALQKDDIGIERPVRGREARPAVVRQLTADFLNADVRRIADDRVEAAALSRLAALVDEHFRKLERPVKEGTPDWRPESLERLLSEHLEREPEPIDLLRKTTLLACIGGGVGRASL